MRQSQLYPPLSQNFLQLAQVRSLAWKGLGLKSEEFLATAHKVFYRFYFQKSMLWV